MIHIRPERLREVVAEVFIAGGVPEVVATQVAQSLVESNLTGHDSHGVLRISYYVRDLFNGRLTPHTEITPVRESDTTALVDGHGNFGIFCAHRAMDMAMEKARAHNVGVVAMANTHHTGRMGAYVVQAAEAGLIGLVFCRSSALGGAVAPYGGISRVLNTNPIAWGVPAATHPPVFMDFATSSRAQGKLSVAIDEGRPIPEGWLLDAEGQPTTDPHAYEAGGALLPFGEHKGYGLGTLVELVAGGLTGTGCAIFPDFVKDYATVVMALNIEAFCPEAQFRHMVDRFIASVKTARKAPGVEEILVPGEPEWRARERHMRDGLQLPDATWQRIVDAGAQCGVKVQD